MMIPYLTTKACTERSRSDTKGTKDEGGMMKAEFSIHHFSKTAELQRLYT
jgi:hypothetical protein